MTFDASTSQAGSGSGSIVSYAWSFGDGDTGRGMTVSHTYDSQNSFNVTLTVTNDRGLVASRTQAVTIGSAGLPTPVFTVSPAAPNVGQLVFFNASASTPGAGGAISSYTWTFGDGATGSGASVSHAFATAGSFIVQLTVTDAAGLSATSSGTSVAVTAAGGGTCDATCGNVLVLADLSGRRRERLLQRVDVDRGIGTHHLVLRVDIRRRQHGDRRDGDEGVHHVRLLLRAADDHQRSRPAHRIHRPDGCRRQLVGAGCDLHLLAGVAGRER